jgi:hypothetical protein
MKLPAGHELFEATPPGKMREGVIYVTASLAYWRGWLTKAEAQKYGVES